MTQDFMKTANNAMKNNEEAITSLELKTENEKLQAELKAKIEEMEALKKDNDINAKALSIAEKITKEKTTNAEIFASMVAGSTNGTTPATVKANITQREILQEVLQAFKSKNPERLANIGGIEFNMQGSNNAMASNIKGDTDTNAGNIIRVPEKLIMATLNIPTANTPFLDNINVLNADKNREFTIVREIPTQANINTSDSSQDINFENSESAQLVSINRKMTKHKVVLNIPFETIENSALDGSSMLQMCSQKLNNDFKRQLERKLVIGDNEDIYSALDSRYLATAIDATNTGASFANKKAIDKLKYIKAGFNTISSINSANFLGKGFNIARSFSNNAMITFYTNTSTKEAITEQIKENTTDSNKNLLTQNPNDLDVYSTGSSVFRIVVVDALDLNVAQNSFIGFFANLSQAYVKAEYQPIYSNSAYIDFEYSVIPNINGQRTHQLLMSKYIGGDIYDFNSIVPVKLAI